MQNALSQPVQANRRTVIVDVLRGWALFGVVLMNYYDFFTLDRDWEKFRPDALTDFAMYVVSLFFAAKSWTLLSILFGYGFAVLMDRVSDKGLRPYRFFAGRMFWLLVLAVINSTLFFGDILKDYAVLGLLLLPFYRCSARTVLITSLILLLAVPFLVPFIYSLKNTNWNDLPKLFPLYQSNNIFDVLKFGLQATWLVQVTSKPYLVTVHVVMFACMLWGFALYKIDFFNNLSAKLRYIKKTFWLSILVAVIVSLSYPIASKLKWSYLDYFNPRYWAILATMLAIASGICWLFSHGKLKSLFNSFAFFGKMTLTNYIVQNAVGMLVFSGAGLGIWNSRPLWFYLLLAVVVYIVQAIFSVWWLKKYNYGPIEWIWRQLSYWKKLPLKRNLEE